MINPKSISPYTLPSCLLEARENFPEISCIYFAIDSSGQIQYVGRAVNLRNRWRKAHHHRTNELEKIGNIKIAWLEIEDSSLLFSIEAICIKQFKPLLNKTPCKQADNRNRITVNINEDIATLVKGLALKENRSFTRQTHVLLNEAIANRQKVVLVENLKIILRQFSPIELTEVLTEIASLFKENIKQKQ